MRSILPIVAGMALAGGLTHLMIWGGRNLTPLARESTYFGASQRVVLYANQVWSRAYGKASILDCWTARQTADDGTSVVTADLRQIKDLRNAETTACESGDVQAFAHAYMRTVVVLCPSLGFTVFLLLGRYHPRLQLWRPLAVVVIATGLPHWGFWPEIARAALVALAMMGSVGFRHWSRDASRAIV